MNTEGLRVIPKRNYIILGTIILITLLLLYYFYMWIDAYNETKLNRPILDKYLEVINYNELEDYLIENPDTIIYISVLENSEIRNFEKQFKSCLKRKEIAADILYMNITDIIADKVKVKEVNERYKLNNLSIIDVPVVAVFADGKLEKIYNIGNNDYNIDGFKSFISDISFNNEDELYG